jgi:ketosteroid isomerase-like protein
MANRAAQFRAIAAMFDAFARLDADAFASHLTEDVVFRPSGFVTEIRTWLDHGEGLGHLAGPEQVPFPD